MATSWCNFSNAVPKASSDSEGTLYPLLYRMEAKGWIKGEWETAEGHRRRRVYRITARGRRQLARRAKQWAGLAHGMALILGGPAHA